MHAKLTTKHKRFIVEHRLLISSTQMAALLDCDKSTIQRFLKQQGLTPPREVLEQFRVAGLTGKTTSTPSIDRYLKKHYLDLNETRLAAAVEKSTTFVHTRLRQLWLIIAPEMIEARKLASRIKPGHIPFNKGKKITEFMSKQGLRKSKAARFKKGQLPLNTKADGVITKRTDKRGVSYLHIRVAQGEWIHLHRYNWQQVHGPIPPKMKLVFKDRNTLNCNVDNLELLTPGELMKRNSYHNYPKPIARIIQLRGALNRQINKHLKKLR